MPNTNLQWNELMLVGNSIELQAANEMIKHVKKFEACKQKASSKAYQPLNNSEFCAIFEKLQADIDMIAKYGNSALMVSNFT